MHPWSHSSWLYNEEEILVQRAVKHLISEIKVELNSADSRSPGQRQIALLALSPSWRAYVSAAPAHGSSHRRSPFPGGDPWKLSASTSAPQAASAVQARNGAGSVVITLRKPQANFVEEPRKMAPYFPPSRVPVSRGRVYIRVAFGLSITKPRSSTQKEVRDRHVSLQLQEQVRRAAGACQLPSMGAIRARSPSWTRTCRLLLVMAFAVTAALGARTGPRGGAAPGHGGGSGAGAARIPTLDDASRPGPSCCTNNRNTGGSSSCCPTP